jgi:hypothetical protein
VRRKMLAFVLPDLAVTGRLLDALQSVLRRSLCPCWTLPLRGRRLSRLCRSLICRPYPRRLQQAKELQDQLDKERKKLTDEVKKLEAAKQQAEEVRSLFHSFLCALLLASRLG